MNDSLRAATSRAQTKFGLQFLWNPICVALKPLPWSDGNGILNGMKDELLVAIDKAGRVVIPKEIREELAIAPGEKLRLSIQGDVVTLSPKKGGAGFFRRKNALVFSAAADDLLEREAVDDILSDLRQDRQIAAGLPAGKANR